MKLQTGTLQASLLWNALCISKKWSKKWTPKTATVRHSIFRHWSNDEKCILKRVHKKHTQCVPLASYCKIAPCARLIVQPSRPSSNGGFHYCRILISRGHLARRQMYLPTKYWNAPSGSTVGSASTYDLLALTQKMLKKFCNDLYLSFCGPKKC